MKKKLFFLLVPVFLLSGCVGGILGPLKLGYKNPALLQLKGKHISVVQERIDYFPHVDTEGFLRNYYYLDRGCVYSGYDNVTYNGWGQIVSRTPINNCGFIRFETNKDGIITDYVEDGYTTETDFEPYFKDLIIIEK